MKSEKLTIARHALERAIDDMEDAHRAWSESVTTLHLAELKLRSAQKHMRSCYSAVADILNGDG